MVALVFHMLRMRLRIRRDRKNNQLCIEPVELTAVREQRQRCHLLSLHRSADPFCLLNCLVAH